MIWLLLAHKIVKQINIRKIYPIIRMIIYLFWELVKSPLLRADNKESNKKYETYGNIKYHLKSKILWGSSDLTSLKLLDNVLLWAATELFLFITFSDESYRVLFIWLILGDKYNFPLISEKSLIEDWVLEFVFCTF